MRGIVHRRAEGGEFWLQRSGEGGVRPGNQVTACGEAWQLGAPALYHDMIGGAVIRLVVGLLCPIIAARCCWHSILEYSLDI